MTESPRRPAHRPPALFVPAGQGQFGERQGLGIAKIDFKLTTEDGRLLILENTLVQKGGPAKHLHHDQDEWFYVLEGEFAIDVGQERFRLVPGDSLLAPRKVPHVWAYLGGTGGRILITFTPAGKMEGFFREMAKSNAMAPQDPELWRAYGMELLGPPLSLG